MNVNFIEKAGFKLFFGIILTAFGMTLGSNSFAYPSFTYVRNNPDGSQTLTGHVPREVKNATAAFKYHAQMTLSAQVILPLANQSQLSSFLQDLYNPKSPNFHHFLTPGQFAQQFAPSSIDSATVQRFLKSEGIYVTGQSLNGAVLNVVGSVGAFEHAFGLHINYYQKTDGTLFFAPDADPTIPAGLAGKILAIGGLDNLPKYHAHLQQNPARALAKAQGSGPGGFLAPNDVKTAYNLNSVTATGSGQSVAVFELDGYSSNDISTYESYFSLPSVPLQNVLIDGFNGVPNFGSNGGADEVTIDIELVAAYAPGSSNIYVYEAPNTTQSWMDEWTKIASDDKAKVISCSWGMTEMDSPTLNFDNQIFGEMAAQGQAVFVAAGDSGAFDAGIPGFLSVDEPASQPYATAVGISTLTTTGGAYSSESASVYGGGGVSAYWSIPSYQFAAADSAVKAAMVSTKMRNLPDVVLTADASTPYAFYVDGSWAGFYGSSISTPIWASLISRVNQGLGANAPIGSVNSALYSLAQTGSYSNDFHDITAGNNGYYPAEPGFDDATGLGSFNGVNLYNDLVKTAVAVTPPPTPGGLNATAGNAQVSLGWNASLGATSYDVYRSTASNGTYTAIASLVLNTTYTDTSVTNGTPYYYEVSAVNSAGQSSNSAPVSATPVLPVPATPVGLKAIGGIAQVVLSWNASTLATSYNVKKATVSGGTYTTVSTPAGTSYTDTSVSNGNTYYYVVSALNASGQSVNSAQVSATPSATQGVAPPTDLTGTATTYYRLFPEILLEWNKSTSPNISKYYAYRSTGSGTPVYYGSVGASYSGAYDTGVSYGTTYHYYLIAVSTSGAQSPASNEITVVMPAAPSAKR